MLVASITAAITDAVTGAIGDHGVYAVFLLMLIDAVFPAASELVMVYAGALAAGFAGSKVVLFGEPVEAGFWAFLTMALVGSLGYTIGAIGGWAIGVYGGRPFLERHGRWLHLNPQQLAKAERWFDRWDELAVFVGRITPVARSFISIPAGVFRMSLGRYTVLTAIGSTLWCFAFAAVGWALGSRWERFHHEFRYVDYAVAAAILLLGAALIIRKRRSSRLGRRAADTSG